MHKKNEFSNRKLSDNQTHWLQELNMVLVVGNYGGGTIRNYVMEMRLLFQYHLDREVESIIDADINDYIFYIKTMHGVGYAKCKMVAHACSFFFKHVIKKPYALPSKLFPRKQTKLPNIMSEAEVSLLLSLTLDPRERVLLGILYGSGLRLGEARNLKLSDIDRAGSRLLVRQGKGQKDRYTLLPQCLLTDLEVYWRAYRMKGFIFESPQIKGRALHQRSLQILVNKAMTGSGFDSGQYTAHTLRHSFATHLLDQGSDIHTIKELLGHSKIETTMVYLHLQQSKRAVLVSPLDKLHAAQ